MHVSTYIFLYILYIYEDVYISQLTIKMLNQVCIAGSTDIFRNM